jgi:hypothetical protein
VLHDIAAQVVTDQIRVPVGGGHEPLHPIRGALADVLGQLPAVLATYVAQQPTQIGQHPPTRLRAHEPTRDPGAHIKRRSLCTEDERRDFGNVAMLACKFGCDALFEDGYLAVHQDGTVLVATVADGLSHIVVERLHALRGRVCGAFTVESAHYFGWHRHNVFLG